MTTKPETVRCPACCKQVEVVFRRNGNELFLARHDADAEFPGHRCRIISYSHKHGVGVRLPIPQEGGAS